jgi:hypothetical protein
MADSPLPAEVGLPRMAVRGHIESTFGAGRDFDVSDTSGTRVLFVDGKIGPIPKAEVRDAKDTVVYRVKGHLLAIPRRMAISTVDGAQVAELKAKALSIVKDKSTLTMVDGSTWQVQGPAGEELLDHLRGPAHRHGQPEVAGCSRQVHGRLRELPGPRPGHGRGLGHRPLGGA